MTPSLKYLYFLETCQDDCCIQGPSRYIVESKGPADGVGWPEKHDSVEACAQRCKDLKDCQAFHYYNVPEPSERTCYLQRGGIIGPQLDDGVMRLAGVCPKTGKLVQLFSLGPEH